MLKMFLHPEQIMVTTIMKTLESINSIIEHIHKGENKKNQNLSVQKTTKSEMSKRRRNTT